MMTHRWLTILIGAVVVCESGCAPKGNNNLPSAAPPPKVPVFTVRQQLVEKKIEVPVDVEGFQQAPLMAKIDAYVGEVKVDIGQEVLLGTPLIRLEAQELTHEVTRKTKILEQSRANVDVYDAELRAAQAGLQEQQAVVDLRQSEHDGLQKLVNRGALGDRKLEEAAYRLTAAKAALISRQNAVAVASAKLVAARRRIDVAQAELDQAIVMAGYREINAPFGGIITERKADVGEFVRPATQGGSTEPLLTLVRVDLLRAVLYVTMDQAALIDDGDRAILVFDDVPDEPFEGQISRNSRAFLEGTRMLRVEIDIPNTRDPASGDWKYRPGSYGIATIIVDVQQLPVVPKTAVMQADGSASVMLVDQEGTCHERSIQIGLATDEWIGVAAGLEPGDRVVAENPSQVEDQQTLPSESIVDATAPQGG